MKKNYLWIALLVSIGWSCQNEEIGINLPETENMKSRALYDNGYVEWDNTLYLNYKYGSDNLETNKLPVPWASGTSHSMGIPGDWFDRNLMDSDPTKRVYSHVNGWEMVYSNLLEVGASNKYFALYNKYTGKLRMFFYALNGSSSSNSSATFAGFQVKGSSLLNFTYTNPQAMDYKPSVATYVFAPECDFGAALNKLKISDSTYLLPGLTYASNNWYGLELECAYDETTSTTNSLAIKLWSADITMSSSEGETIGEIVGNISTTYSNTPAFDLSLSLSNENKSSVSVTQTVNNGGIILGDKLAEEIIKGEPFFTGIWNKISLELPSIAAKGVQQGVNALFTGSASLLTDWAGKLVNSIFGWGETETMSALSEVKLKSNSTISLNTISTTTAPGWGEIKDLPLPGYGESLALYNKKLGVWNIRTAPVVNVDMNTTSYFNNSGIAPAAIIIGQTPIDWEAKYNLSLQPIDLVVNPEVLKDFTVQNVNRDLVFTNDFTGVTVTPQPYGIYNDMYLYIGAGTTGVSAIDRHGLIELNGYDPDTSFEQGWLNKIEEISNNVYCRVSFQLKHKTTSETIGFSKYFKVNPIKGTHSHTDVNN